MGSERPKRRGGVFRRLLNLVLIVYWLWFSAEDTPSAKIENGTPCSGQFSGARLRTGSGPRRDPVTDPVSERPKRPLSRPPAVARAR